MNLELNYPEDLRNDISALKNELAEIKLNLQPKDPPKYLTRNEVADMLQVNLSTIHNWTTKGVLKSFQLGGRIYYRANDIENALVELKK
jgi:hypothetical protein